MPYVMPTNLPLQVILVSPGKLPMVCDIPWAQANSSAHVKEIIKGALEDYEKSGAMAQVLARSRNEQPYLFVFDDELVAREDKDEIVTLNVITARALVDHGEFDLPGEPHPAPIWYDPKTMSPSRYAYAEKIQAEVAQALKVIAFHELDRLPGERVVEVINAGILGMCMVSVAQEIAPGFQRFLYECNCGSCKQERAQKAQA